MFFLILRRELGIAFRKSTELINPLWFFLLIVTLFSLAVGPHSQLLGKIAPGVLWVAALLATLLSLERLFKEDYQDGSLEQLMLLSYPLSLAVLAKVAAHWLLTGVLLLGLSPLAALFLFLDFATWRVIFITLLMGTPILSFIGAVGAALTVSLRKGGVLLSLLILPLYIPVLIMATLIIDTELAGMPIQGYLAILGAMLTSAVTLAPFATAAALRISL